MMELISEITGNGCELELSRDKALQASPGQKCEILNVFEICLELRRVLRQMVQAVLAAKTSNDRLSVRREFARKCNELERSLRDCAGVSHFTWRDCCSTWNGSPVPNVVEGFCREVVLNDFFANQEEQLEEGVFTDKADGTLEFNKVVIKEAGPFVLKQLGEAFGIEDTRTIKKRFGDVLRSESERRHFVLVERFLSRCRKEGLRDKAIQFLKTLDQH
jgi:hypothetical protein